MQGESFVCTAVPGQGCLNRTQPANPVPEEREEAETAGKAKHSVFAGKTSVFLEKIDLLTENAIIALFK